MVYRKPQISSILRAVFVSSLVVSKPDVDASQAAAGFLLIFSVSLCFSVYTRSLVKAPIDLNIGILEFRTNEYSNPMSSKVESRRDEIFYEPKLILKLRRG